MNRYRIILSVALLLAISSGAMASGPAQLAGNVENLWMLRPNAGQETFNAYHRASGGEWRVALRDATGQFERACAVGDRLEIVYARQQRTRVSIDGSLTPAEAVPGRLIAMCEQPASENRPAVLLACVEETQTPTDPKTPDAPKTQGVQWSLYESVSTGWKRRASWPAPKTPVASGSMTAMNGTILLCVPGPKLAFYSLDPAAPKLTRPLLPFKLKNTAVRSELLQIDTQLAMVQFQRSLPKTMPPTSQPAAVDPVASQLQTWTPSQPEASAIYPVQQADTPLTWPGADSIQMTAFSRQLAMLWEADGTRHFALVSPSGVAGEIDAIDATLDALVNPKRLAKIMEWFSMGIALLTVLCVVLGGSKSRLTPYAIPPQFIPASLIKRVVACILDVLPINFIMIPAVLMLGYGMSWDDLQSLQVQWDQPEQIGEPQAVAGLVTICVYIAYGILTEWKWGQTLGGRIMRIRVVSCSGEKLTLRVVAIRNLTKLMELMMVMSPDWFGWILKIMVFWPLVGRYHQRLGDIFARTAVIDSRVNLPLPVAITGDLPS